MTKTYRLGRGSGRWGEQRYNGFAESAALYNKNNIIKEKQNEKGF